MKPATTYAAVFGAVLAKIREEHSRTQQQMAEVVEVTQSTWSKIERGESVLTVVQLLHTATAFDLSPERVLMQVSDAVRDLTNLGIEVHLVQLEPQTGSEYAHVARSVIRDCLTGEHLRLRKRGSL